MHSGAALPATAWSLMQLRLQEERSQGRNRERAMALLRAKLFELELEKQRRYTPHWGWAASVTWGMCCRCSYAS